MKRTGWPPSASMGTHGKFWKASHLRIGRGPPYLPFA